MAHIGKYRLERELGRGGMGVVWEAYDEQLKRRVAIKLMRYLGQVLDSQHQRFEREARAIARLRNPYVVQLYDYGISENGEPFMVMELLEGESLEERLRRTKNMTPTAFLPVLSQTAKALDAAHAAGIVHRDLKPANIFLMQQGGEIAVKILDFGVSAMHGDITTRGLQLTGDNQLLGTPQYMSPEQARAEVVDHRSDLWSLAAVTYQAVTGQLPFSGPHLATVLTRICLETPMPPSQINPELGAGADRFFERAFAKNRHQRFESARDMVASFSESVVTQEDEQALKILVVDDEPDVSLLIEQCFQIQIDANRYQFVFAENGQEALSLLQDHGDIEIILTDINMPNMDGLTLLDRIRKLGTVNRAIVVSAYGDMKNIRRAMNCGAFDFLVKPLDFDDLEVTMEKAAKDVRATRKALKTMEENQTLRMFVSPSVLTYLTPMLKVSGTMAGECIDASIVAVTVYTDNVPEYDAQTAISHLNQTYDILFPCIEQDDGIIARFFGDTLIALFRDRDHFARALATAVRVLRQLRTPAYRVKAKAFGKTARVSAPRIGIASGPTIMGQVGAPSKHRYDFATFGVPVHMALELAGVAHPSEILIPASQAALVAEPFHCRPSDRQVLNGEGTMVNAMLVGKRRSGDGGDAEGDITDERGQLDDQDTVLM